MDVIFFHKIRSAVLVTAALLILFPLCFKEANAISASHIYAAPAFDGAYKKDFGLPLKITIENPENRPVEGDIKITGSLIEYGIIVHLEPYSTYEKWILVYPSAGSDLIMQFNSQDGYSFNKEIRTTQFISRKMLILHISKEKGKMPYANSPFNNEDAFIDVTPGDLWDMWKGYEEADHVLLDADAVEMMTASQLTALKRYVISGGSLYIGGSRYPEIYGQDFFQDMLPAGKKGLGSVSLLSFDPADKTFQAFLSLQGGLIKSYEGQKRIALIPADSPAEEAGKIFLNVVKWNTGYLLFLALAGFAWNKRYRRFLWPLFSILVVVASLASMGMLNGRNRLQGISIINISNDGEDAFLQSRLSLISVNSTGMSAEFPGGFIYPADTDAGADKIRVNEAGLTKKITSDMMMLGRKDLIWERFEKQEKVLNVNLNIYPDGVRGDIENLSEYDLKEPFLWISGNFFHLPSIKAGDKISVSILYGKDASLPYPEGRQWISKYIQRDAGEEASQELKIIGLWERPLLKSIESGLFVEKEKTFLLYHM